MKPFDPTQPREQTCKFCHVTIRGDTLEDFESKWDPHIESDEHFKNVIQGLMLDTGAESLEELPQKLRNMVDEKIEENDIEDHTKKIENWTDDEFTSIEENAVDILVSLGVHMLKKNKSVSDVQAYFKRLSKESLGYARRVADGKESFV